MNKFLRFLKFLGLKALKGIGLLLAYIVATIIICVIVLGAVWLYETVAWITALVNVVLVIAIVLMVLLMIVGLVWELIDSWKEFK